jgi:Xaa-Pro aminopeptidase
VSAYGPRIAALRERMSADGLGALVVSRAANVRYLTGYVGTNGTAVIGHDAALLLTDSRYAVSAREQVRDAEVVIGSRDLLGDIAAAARDHAGGGPVGVEADTVTVGWHGRFCARAEGVDVRPVHALVEELRIVKDADEVAAMRRAAAVADEALRAVLDAGIVGRPEKRVAFDLYGAMLERGAEDLSFPTIVAAGPRGARPHAVPGPDPIPAGTLVVIDMGAVVDGYCSDMTRTVATGPLPPRMDDIYRTCLDAQLAALAAARPGIRAGDLDAVAREVIASAGHGDHFGHGLGHGVGLEIHEAPGVRPGIERMLEEGMAITIEPGIYIEGLAGVRIEDLVVLTGDGRDIISATPKDLTVVA